LESRTIIPVPYWDWSVKCKGWQLAHRETSETVAPILSLRKDSYCWYSGGPLLLVQCQLISIHKLESGDEQHHSI
jgi:hypothetical protein